METISTYETITHKILLDMNKRQKFPSDIIYKILNDNDAFYNLVSKVMEADWKHDESKSSLHTIRYNYCLYGVKSYITKLYKQNKRHTRHFCKHDRSISGNDRDLPDKIVEKQDYNQHIRSQISTLDNRYSLPIIKYFFENKTYKQIGQELGYSREYVRILINDGLRKLQTCL